MSEIYEGRLDKKYLGLLRNPMIYKYRNVIKRNPFIGMHKAIKLSDGELAINKPGKDGTWDLNLFQKLTNLNIGENKLKRKVSKLHTTNEGVNSSNNSKKTKSAPTLSQNLHAQSPLGLIWDSKDYSCAYDLYFFTYGMRVG